MSNPYESLIAQADAHLAEGSPPDAYRVLSGLLAPQRPIPEAHFVQVMGALGRISAAMGAAELLERIQAVVASPDDADALYRLGWALIEQGAPAAALQVLLRANALVPGNSQLLQELATAYADLGMHASAAEALMTHPELLTEPMMSYLLAFNGIMAGGIQIARDQLAGMKALAEDPDLGFMASTIVDMVARHDATKAVSSLDAGDLPGWHLVTTGGLLLHTADPTHEGMNGRYALVQDSTTLCLEGLRAVQLVLTAWGEAPSRIWAFPDEHSHALAHAAGVLLEAEVGEWSPEVADEPGLVVAYDLRDAPAELLQPLRTKRPGQIVWQHAAQWTARQPIAPDLCTFVYQFLRHAWSTEEAKSSEERGRDILAATLPEDAGRGKASLLTLARLEAEESGAPLGRRAAGWRARFWGTSPVRSSRFV